jgi:hypothetical protein
MKPGLKGRMRPFTGASAGITFKEVPIIATKPIALQYAFKARA